MKALLACTVLVGVIYFATGHVLALAGFALTVVLLGVILLARGTVVAIDALERADHALERRRRPPGGEPPHQPR